MNTMTLTTSPISQPGGYSLLALRRGKSGGSGGSGGPHGSGDRASNDAGPPTPRWVFAAVVVGVLLLFAGLFIFVTSGGETPEPTITGESAPVARVDVLHPQARS